jgi:hypothetical protein
MTGPHLSDEQLNAAFDGEDAEAQRHVDGCSECEQRWAELERVAAAVGVVPRVDELARERALGAAARTPMAPRPRAGGARSNRTALVLGAVAAALVLIVGLVAVNNKGTDRRVTDMAAKGSADLQAAEVADGDLGTLNSDEELLAAIGPAIGEGSPNAAGGTGSAGVEQGGGTSGADSKSAASTSTSVSNAPMAAPSGAPLRQARSNPPCGSSITQTYGNRVGALLYSASVQWGGVPAVVLAYEMRPPAGSRDHWVFVLARSDCRPIRAITI